MVVIDNFTMLQHLIGEVNTTNIARALSALKQASINNDIAVILVTHPTKLIEGQEVTAYSVNGSANFYNISDFIFSLKISDYEAKETTIKVLKVRDSAKGVMGGKCVLKYNPVHLTYSDMDSSTEDSQHDTPKDINYDIAREVMKEIEEEAKQAKQEDTQPAPPAAGTASTTPTKQQGTPANTPSRDNNTKQPQIQPATAPAVEQTAGQPAAGQPAAKEEVKKEKQAQRITPDFLTNTKVSILEQHKVLKISSLYNSIIMGKEHKKEIEAVRQIDRQANESEYRQAKAKVLSFTPSCVCKGETAKEVEHVNNLIAIDLDAKDNENITIEEMRKRVNSLPYVMYSSLSVGGKGMYALIPIAEANKNDFKAVFNALNEDFTKLGLKLDSSCINVNRERYMSYDKAEYWNKECEIYSKKLNIPTQAHDTHKRVESGANKPLTERDKQKVDLMIEDIKQNKIQLSKNHYDTLAIANCLANIWGEDGRELLHTIRQQRSGYDEYKTDSNFDYVLDHLDEGERYGLGLIFTKYKEAKGQTQVN